MAISKLRAKRKVTGGVYRDFRKKKVSDLGREPTLTRMDKKRIREIRVRSGGCKFILLSTDEMNVYDPKTKKYKKAKIKTVVENNANRHYVRRNILTKGTIVETDLGKAKITSRPGQEPVVNGVLVQKDF